MSAIKQTTRLEGVDSELRLARIQLLRALHVEAENPDVAGLDDIFLEILSRIEALALARCVLLMTARLARGVLQ